MFKILESQAPAKQTASDTISTLSGRLQSATLLEDRRAAILGLRSFAKLYPASVASGGLKNLIACLGSDIDDVDTIKVILETLLMLFSPDESSPEASDEIALWLSDEFTQHQENIALLLNILERQDFFCRLYALQLISAISSARPERTQECVYTAPLGVSRLVSILDDKRDAIRSEGLLLLSSLTPGSPDLQKLVAFENAFDRVFDIINAEGSLTDGGVIVQDCLGLLDNLLRLNVSNQSFFRETGGIKKISAVLQHVLEAEKETEEEPEWSMQQRNKNLWGFLSVIRLFLNVGSVGTHTNQTSFWQQGVAFQIMDIAFHPTLSPTVKSEALSTCADIIRGNRNLQEKFAQRDINFYSEASAQPQQGEKPKSKIVRVNIIQGLLDTTLAVSSQQPTEVRLAACECVKAYVHGHSLIRQHFLTRAKEGHMSGEAEPDNILTILLEDSDTGASVDPFRQWISSVIMFNLIYEDYDAKNLAMGIKEGDEDKGEEVVTCIQALAGNLISRARKEHDERVTIGYLTVLCGWLFEDPDAVNDFLQEGSNLQSLIQITTQASSQKVIESGLCAFLLGIIYEFSSKDSPIPRSTIHEIYSARLGREIYSERLSKLREHPSIRDFEVPGIEFEQPGGELKMFLDKTFVEFLKDNFSRFLRAIDRDPGMEVPVTANGVQKGISRELVDSLKSQLDDKTKALEKAESEVISLERKLGQEKADHRKAKETAKIELDRIKHINDNLQRNHEQEVKQLDGAKNAELQKQAEAHQSALRSAVDSHTVELQKATQSHNAEMRSVNDARRAELKRMDEEGAAKLDQATRKHRSDVDELESKVQRLENQNKKADKQHKQELSTAHDVHTAEINSLQSQLRSAEEKARAAEAKVEAAEQSAADKEKARAAAQSELDDLLMVLADLEEKRTRDKKRLKSLGADDVSDVEDGSSEEESDEN